MSGMSGDTVDRGGAGITMGVRRRRRVVLSAAPLAGLAAACSGGSPGGAPPSASRPPATIRLATTATIVQQVMPAALPMFNQQHPHITLVVEPKENDWQEKTVAQWLSGTGPDVTNAFNEFLPEWSRKGLLLKLDALIKRDFTSRQLQDYSEYQWKFFSTKERGQHALPEYLATAALGYNTSLFGRAGVPFPDDTWVWSRYAEAMARLTDRDREQFGGQLGSNLPRLQERIIQNGGWVVDPNDDLQCLLDQPPALEAMQWHHDRMWRENVVPQPTQRTGRSLIAQGKVAMFETGSWMLRQFVQDVGDQFEWDVAIYPRGKQRNTVATTDGWASWQESEAPEACWTLLRFLQTDEWIDVYTKATGNQPARKSHAGRWMATVRSSIPQLATKNLSAFVDGITKNYARPNAVVRFDAEVRPGLQQAITSTVDRNEAPLADTIRAAVAAANARLKQLAG
ncbi:MAG TPA: extracellular solute-binding protein [Chloroflexota bacterium]|nr:extracellular solute-binding protein [Chloroflexota bacterium]